MPSSPPQPESDRPGRSPPRGLAVIAAGVEPPRTTWTPGGGIAVAAACGSGGPVRSGALVGPPTTEYGRPSRRSAPGEVAGGDRGADVRAADGLAVERERRDDDDVEAEVPAERRDRLGRPARARSRTPRRASSGSPASRRARRSRRRTRRTASRAARCRRSATTVTATPAASSRSRRSSGSHSSGGAVPVRISSGWWSNVITAGARRARRRPRRARSSRYAWPRCRPSNTPTTTNSRPTDGSSASMPVDDAHRGSRGGRIFVGAIRGALAPADADDRARGVDEPQRRSPSGGRAAPAAGRTKRPWPASRDLGRRERDGRDRLEAGVDGSRSARIAVRAVGRGALADRVERVGALESERAARGPHQRAEVGAASRAARRGRARAPGCTSPRSTRRRRRRSAARGRVSSHSRRSSALDHDVARRQLDGLARARHLVGAPAADLDRPSTPAGAGAARRGTPRAPPRRPRAIGAGPSTGVSSPSRSSVVDVAPKQTVARYALSSREVVLDEPRRAAQEQRQHARRRTGRASRRGRSAASRRGGGRARRRRARSGPAGLATTRTPSHARARPAGGARRSGRRGRETASASRSASARTRRARLVERRRRPSRPPRARARHRRTRRSGPSRRRRRASSAPRAASPSARPP